MEITMLKIKFHYFFIIVLLCLTGGITKAQSDFTNQSRIINGSEIPLEGANYTVTGKTDFSVPIYLMEKLEQARESGDMQRFNAVQQEIKTLYPDAEKEAVTNTGDIPMQELSPPFMGNDWYTNDVLVHSGNVDVGGWRQIDLKQGEDGNLYIAVNRRNTSATGIITVYRSTNYGVTWTNVQGVQSSGAYYGQVSMIVDLRDNGTNYDSTRITLFYTRSTTSNMYDATINFASFRRNGSAWYTGQIGTPTSGRKLLYPTGLSDGQYWGTATYWGVVVGDYINGTSVGDNIKFYKSVNWGLSWSTTTYNTTYNDYYPTAAYDDGGATTSDSVYIAVERRFSTTNYLTRVIVIPWIPATGSYTHFVPPTGSDKYEKPIIAIPQTGAYQNSGRRMLITVIKNNIGVYHMNANGGNGGWQVDGYLASRASIFTWAGTDSNVAAGNYCTVVWTTITGDSVGYRQGQIGTLGTTYHKRNSNNSSPSVNPVCETYRTTGTTRYACLAYAGFGPTNVYYNGETIITGVQQIGNEIPEKYQLGQNYPNPFNPVTNINFSIPKTGNVKLIVYDVLGKIIATLVDGNINSGNYKVNFDASKISSGVYFYRIDCEGFTDVKKMILVK
jgi:hypothetical protein